MVRDAQVVADAEHGIALRKLRIARGDHRPRKIDAADARGPAQDSSLAGGGERVLVVDIRVRDAHHDVAGIQIVEAAFDELGADLSLWRFGQLVGLELLHALAPHSALMPACLTTRVHFAVSALMNWLNSAAPMRSGSA